MYAPLQAGKLSAMKLPFENKLVGMLADLDVKPADEQEPDSNEVVECDGNSEESILPPPMPFFDRRTHATASAPMLLQGVLSRARSSSPNRGAGASGGRGILQARAMTMSMPNLHSNRSTYNRCIGYSVLANDSECGGNRGKQALRSQIDEFETLLEDL